MQPSGQREPQMAPAHMLLIEGEQHLQAGALQQAERLLLQAWERAEHETAECRSRIAWQLVWLKLLMGEPSDAAAWMQRVHQLPAIPASTWQVQRVTFVDLCVRSGLGYAGEAPQALALPAHATALQSLTVRSLGSWALIRGGQQLLPCRSRKATALFRYLLTRPERSAPREELMELLWPATAPGRAAHSLHVTVSALRHYLDDRSASYLTYASGVYAINPAAVIDHDCDAFVQISDDAERLCQGGQTLGAQQAYIKALAYYHGDYVLHDCDLIWAITERERLLTRYLYALEQLGKIWMHANCPESAIECFQRLLQRDEYREDIHCLIIRCYMQLGRRSDALRQYRICAQVLTDDLGLEPMLETQSLYQQVLAMEHRLCG